MEPRGIEVSRRAALLGIGGLAAASVLSGSAVGRQPAATPPAQGAGQRKRAIRIAHLTDIHIQPERRAVAGFASCLHHVQSLDDKPDLIMTGGDHVMDAYDQKLDRVQLQWDLLRQTFKDENSIPMRFCLGNHDIWGWNKHQSGTKGDEKGWGKTMAMDLLELSKPYYSFDKAGWHFVVLDSVRPDVDDPDGYMGGLDDEQFEWLKGDLAANKQLPTMVLTHIPILTVTVLDSKPEKGGDLKISGGLIFTDFARIKNLFQQHPQVKTVISGHMHRIDRVEFQGVTHFCNGAVCGNWWKGKHYEAAEGYTLMDLYDDGSFERKYVDFGWKASEK